MTQLQDQLALVRKAVMDEIADTDFKRDPVSIDKKQQKVGGIFDAISIAVTMHSDKMERIATALESIAKSLQPVTQPPVLG